MDLVRSLRKENRKFTGVENATMCNGYCQRDTNCTFWEYYDGLCYMKSDKTFLIKTKSTRLVSGMKECDGNG